MRFHSIFLQAATVAIAASTYAQAQDAHGGHGGAGTFPEVCRNQAAMPPMGHAGMDMNALNDHQRASMEGMMKMDRDMMQGMMEQDADVAFVCGMIAHHQGAIDMSEVELKHGDNDWAKQMAQKVIDAQKKEIEEMTGWLKKNAD